jgi:acetyl-CoA carboxylase carboxyl transferase subunit beta
MGLFSRNKPKIKVQKTEKDGFSGWLKCAKCAELIHVNELEKNLQCCPKCDHHYRLTAKQRIESLADAESFTQLFDELRTVDTLKFVDTRPYPERLAEAQKKSGQSEGAIVGTCRLDGQPICLGILDFSFIGGSMGSVVGERITRIIELALMRRLPLIIVSTSGGARMQESILSLMQMAKTSGALAKLGEKGVPFISILTNPTSGGVTASFASLGDVIIAEPEALICFSGPRVIEQTIREKLPEEAQKSEFLLQHGMVDCIVKRHDLKKTVAKLLDLLTGNERAREERGRAAKGDAMRQRLEELINAS